MLGLAIDGPAQPGPIAALCDVGFGSMVTCRGLPHVALWGYGQTPRGCDPQPNYTGHKDADEDRGPLKDCKTRSDRFFLIGVGRLCTRRSSLCASDCQAGWRLRDCGPTLEGAQKRHRPSSSIHSRCTCMPAIWSFVSWVHGSGYFRDRVGFWNPSSAERGVGLSARARAMGKQRRSERAAAARSGQQSKGPKRSPPASTATPGGTMDRMMGVRGEGGHGGRVQPRVR